MNALITWRNFLILSAFVLFLYYLTVLFILHRHHPKDWNRKAFRAKREEQKLQDINEMIGGTLAENLAAQAGRLIDDLNRLFLPDHLPPTKNDLLTAIQTKLIQYPKLKQSDFRQGINQHIIVKTENQYHFSISEDEVNVLWD